MGKPYVRQVEVVGLVERLGTIILFDDFEDLFKWDTSGTGTDWIAEKSTLVAYNGDASLHLKTKATTPTAGDKVRAARATYVPIGKKVSLECFFRFETQTNEDYLCWVMRFYDGSIMHEGMIRYLPPENKWQYLNSANVWTDVPGGAQTLREARFHRLKWMIDFDKNEYVMLQSDDLIIDLTGTKSRTVTSTVESYLAAMLEISAETAAQAEAYMDDFFLKEE